jgi:tetratricopeptide (TPR) repeat protein
LAVITVLALLQARARPWLIVGWLWFLGTLVPVIGLVQVSVQTMADRYSYLPLLGVFIMAAWVIPGDWARWPRPGLVFDAVIAGLLVFLLAGMEAQLQYWRNSVTLFSHTVSVTPDNLLAEYNLGAALAARGDDDPAILHYQKALAIHPNRVEAGYNMQTEVHFNLGLLFRTRKQWAEAEAQFRAFIQEQPGLANGHYNLATALIGLGRVDEGTGEFREALAIDLRTKVPDDAHVFAALDAAYAETGNYSEAIAAAEKARAAALALGDQKLAAAAEKRLATYRAVNLR